MSETKLFNFRLSIELMDAVKAKAGKTSMTDIVTSLLADWLAPAPASALDAHLVPELQAEVASLRAEVKRLRALSVDTVKQAVAKPIAQHAAGPVLPATGLRVRGTARPMFKPGTNADKAAKSG